MRVMGVRVVLMAVTVCLCTTVAVLALALVGIYLQKATTACYSIRILMITATR